MEPLEIKKYPQRILRKECKPLAQITEREKALFEQMFFTMRLFSGIGLAAPQVGLLERLIVAEVEGKVIKLANPEIVGIKGTDNMQEGCLSVPGLGVDVTRPCEALVKGVNADGQIIEIKAQGLLARVLQHEIDHLCGKLIIDYLPFWKKVRFRTTNHIKE